MKRVLLLVLFAMLVMTGCSDKEFTLRQSPDGSGSAVSSSYQSPIAAFHRQNPSEATTEVPSVGGSSGEGSSGTASSQNTSSSDASSASSEASPSADTSSQPVSSAPGQSAPVYPLTDAERDRIERVVMTACGGLGIYRMDVANAQVIKDRLTSGKFGNSVMEVLTAPNQFETPWKGQVDEKVKEAVAAVFDNGARVTDVPIYYYYNPYISEVRPSTWEKSKRYVLTLGVGKWIHEYWTDQ